MRIGIGQDSHAFCKNTSSDKNADPNDIRPLMLGGIVIPDHVALDGNSDADVVLHAITNAISGITCVNILGSISDEMCLRQGITDSREYLKKALSYMDGFSISNISVSIECKTPRISPHIDAMRSSIADLLGITPDRVGITATTGEGLTAFGRGEGIQAFAQILAEECGEKQHE